MALKINNPGYWLLSASNGNAALVDLDKTGTISGQVNGVYLGSSLPSEAALNTAVGQLGLVGLYEQPGGLAGIIASAKRHGGSVLIKAGTGGIQGQSLVPFAIALVPGLGEVADGLLTSGSSAYELLAGESTAGTATDAANPLDETTSTSDQTNESDQANATNADNLKLAQTFTESDVWNLLGKLLKWLESAKSWETVLKFIGGAVAVGVAIRELEKT